MRMLVHVLTAVVVAIIVGLACLLAGELLLTLHVPIAATVGGFLVEFAWVIGILAGLLHFLRGGVIL